MGISTLRGAAQPVGLSSATPADVALAAVVGAATTAARGDHTHKVADSGWLTPTLLNGWAVYDATFGNAAMYRKIGPIVFLRGLIRSGTMGATAFNLPAGYRPGIRMLFGIDSGGAYVHGRVDVHVNGDVVPVGGQNAYFQISCAFPADN